MTIIASPIRIVQISTLWNIQLIAAFSSPSNYCYPSRQCNDHKPPIPPILQLRRCDFKMTSLSTSTNMQDKEGRREVVVTARRCARKDCVESSISSVSITANGAVNTSTDTTVPSDSTELLEQWIQHDHHNYHLVQLSPDRAYKIRTALVQWYRANRRKLPWRGDVGPYDGSTAGYGAAATTAAALSAPTLTSSGGEKKKRKKKNAIENEGKDIRSFFTSSNSSSSSSSWSQPKHDVKGVEKDNGLSNVSELAVSFQSTEVTPYGVWVSEIMLQQTRVEAVIPYWIKWMLRFPTVFSLAEATDEEVNSHWAGLGFYRRARLLHAGAKKVVNQYNGVVPNTVQELMKVEGIGRYTASAIASIAYGVEVPVVDGNVCRVLCRLTGIANHIKAGVLKDDLGWVLAERIVQAKGKYGCSDAIDGTPGEINQALMELGATYCCPSGSGVDEGDPLRSYYISCQLGVAIGQMRENATSLDRVRIASLVANKSSAVINVGKQCRLCEPNGVTNMYFDVLDRTGTDIIGGSKVKNKFNIYAAAGHASLPIPPPKKSKREEVIAVAVISIRLPSEDEQSWLMVKRPSEGLLSGQWEFPAVCVWNSAEHDTTKKSKNQGVIEVPFIDPEMRSSALDSFLSKSFQSTNYNFLVKSLQKRKQINNAPVVHVFSHVCHTMWVEHVDLGAIAKCSFSMKRWESNGREVGWLTERDMEQVGITSGVRKVLGAVQP